MIELREDRIDPYQILAHFESTLPIGAYGANASFIGYMRDFNEAQTVQSMYLEHYAPMTQNAMATLRQQLIEQYQLIDALIVHRVGQIEIGDAIVVIGCWSAHRKAAYEASREGMERLKSSVPLWKRETLKSGEQRWVEKNTAGY